MNLITLLATLATSHAIMSSLQLDWWYRTCNTVVGKNAAITSKCKGSTGKKLLACACKIDDWQQSMYQCMVVAADKTDKGASSVEDSWVNLQGYCMRYDVHTPSYKEMKAKVDANPISQTFNEANSTKSGAFQPPSKGMDIGSLENAIERHYQYEKSELFGMITIWYIMGIMFVQAVLHWSAYIMPGFVRVVSNNRVSRTARRYVVLPALFNRHRASPMKLGRYFMLCFPPRLHVIFFTGYLFLSVFFLAFHYPYINNNNYWDSYKHLVSAYLSYRSGQLGMYKMPLVFLFAGRNNVLIWLTGLQMEVFNHWHRWIARLFTIDIIIHAIAYTVDELTSETLVELWQKTYVKWGGVAIAAMCLLCVNGTKSLRQLCYEVFLYLHIALAICAVVGTFYHIGVHKGIDNCWAVIGIWAFDRAVRLIRIVMSNPFAKANVKAHPGGTMEVTIKYSGLWKPRAGTYIFVHFLHPLYCFQSHPFTVVPVDEKGEMKLYCKALKGITSKMYNRALHNGGECSTRVLVEGPYGVEFSTKQYKEVVLLAGGIGITAIYSHLREIIRNGESQIVHVHWAISSTDSLSWFKKELDRMVAHSNVHVIIHLNEASSCMRSATNESSEESVSIEKKEVDASSTSNFSISNVSINRVWIRPNFERVVLDHIENAQGDIVIFVCGPSTMSDAVRSSVATNLFKTRHYVQYYEESFSM